MLYSGTLNNNVDYLTGFSFIKWFSYLNFHLANNNGEEKYAPCIYFISGISEKYELMSSNIENSFTDVSPGA